MSDDVCMDPSVQNPFCFVRKGSFGDECKLKWSVQCNGQPERKSSCDVTSCDVLVLDPRRDFKHMHQVFL